MKNFKFAITMLLFFIISFFIAGCGGGSSDSGINNPVGAQQDLGGPLLPR
jgi:hypothetical protein